MPNLAWDMPTVPGVWTRPTNGPERPRVQQMGPNGPGSNNGPERPRVQQLGPNGPGSNWARTASHLELSYVSELLSSLVENIQGPRSCVCRIQVHPHGPQSETPWCPDNHTYALKKRQKGPTPTPRWVPNGLQIINGPQMAPNQMDPIYLGPILGPCYYLGPIWNPFGGWPLAPFAVF